jgi:hypothetical protein
MKSERFKRTKSVMASGAIALVVAALALGVSSSVLGSRSVSQHLGFDLTSGTPSFTITSSIYPSPACSGSTALLYPGTARCMVFSVHNNLKAAISVQSITTALDTTNYPAPPADCAGTGLVLPTFSGSFNVSGGGDATSPGVPVELKDNGAPQNDCENYSYNFVYTGSANYTEVYGTSTGLASSQNPSTVGQSVTYMATVTASPTSSQDPVPSSPTGTVTFKDNGAIICNTVAVTSTGTTTATAQCTVNYATTAGSPHPITASYVNTDGNFTGSTSGTLSQVVTSSTLGTTSVLTSSPNPSSYGTSATFSDTVSASSGTPGGTVTFYSCTTNTCGTKTSLGTETLSGGKATYATTSLPVGTTYVEAIYGASGNDAGSTSNVVSQVVLNVPSACAAGTYGDVISGTPADQFLYGTNGNDLIYAFGASYWINGFGGNDCIDAGDGNNLIFDGNGNDGVAAGNGSDTVILGNGNDKVSLGNGSDGVETGDGNDTVTVGNGSQGEIIVGNGNDTVTVGTGSDNQVELGSGTDAVTIQGSHDDINGGNGNETIYLGSGTYNTYSGQAYHTNVCYLPAPPTSYHGTAAAYYHDTLTNCTVVSP